MTTKEQKEIKERMDKMEMYVYALDNMFKEFIESIIDSEGKLNKIIALIHEDDFKNMPITVYEKAYEVLLCCTMGINSLYIANSFNDVLSLLNARQNELKDNTNLN